MSFFWYLMVTLFGALGALCLLRVLERLAFGGGSGALSMQAGMGIGFLLLAHKSLRKAQTLRRPASPRAAPLPRE
ncbi:hypothetical protein FGE12_04965 [Aggregicoccus sp. 17bor-14]|uniref:hypothetical protein n=1 Tax=Myxococcaceae TaxID=31 RepID=UPI00129C1CCC|nr:MULTISPECIES: hypothetical protein [Myxococcaceae]MBF5041731.1 hypothetical protein [Simulacricoccus sp. 17bor-14]MRI87512.1 hypothetical protein [Aggregicoccus sp. 17bor-14]